MLLTAILAVSVLGLVGTSQGTAHAQTAGNGCVEFPLSQQEAADSFGGEASRWTKLANSPSTGYAWRQENLAEPITVTVPGPGLNGNNWRYDSDQGTFYGPAMVTNTVVGTLWQDGFPVICREVAVEGPAELDPEEVGFYTAVFSPTAPTASVTYTWSTVGGTSTITPTGANAEISWVTPGSYQVDVEVHYNNITLIDSQAVTVTGIPPMTHVLYLPVLVKSLPPAPPYVPALSQALCNTYDPVVLFGVAQWERIDVPTNPNDGCGWRLADFEQAHNLTIQPGSRADHSGGPTNGPNQLLNWSGALSIWVTNP